MEERLFQMNDRSLRHLFMAEVTSGCVLIRDTIALGVA